MSEVQQVASLHEKAVQAVASGDVVPFTKPKKRKAKAKSKLVKITPLAEVWEMAKKLAGGDTKRLLVQSEDCVIVMNHPGQYKKVAR